MLAPRAELSHPPAAAVPLVHIVSLLKRESCRPSCVMWLHFFFFLMWLHFVVVKEICLYKHQEIIFSTHELLIIPGKRILEKGFGMYVGELWHPIRLVWSYLNITVIRWDHCFSNEGHLFQTKSHVGPHFLNINAELLLLEVMCTGDNGLQLP